MSLSKFHVPIVEKEIVEKEIVEEKIQKPLVKITQIDTFSGAANGKERGCPCFSSTVIVKKVPYKKEHSPNNRGNHQTVSIYYVGPGQS